MIEPCTPPIRVRRATTAATVRAVSDEPTGRARLTLVVHASTRATATAAFAVDESLDDRGTAAVVRAREHVPRHDHGHHAPDTAAGETHDGLGLAGTSDLALRGWDAGRWAGRTIDDVAASEPNALHSWLTDPEATPHGGESLSSLLARVGPALAAMPSGHTIAVAGPAVVRAATVVVLGAPPSAFWRIDAGPLTMTDLRGGPHRWTIRCTGRPLDPS